MPFQVAPHPKPFGFVITVHTQHPVALSIAWKESTVRRAIKAQPEDQLSYSLAFETHDAIEQALHGIYRRQAWTPSRSFSRNLQGISLPVLQQHLAESPLMTTLFPMPYIVTRDPCHPDNFIVMVCPGHPRHFCKMLSETLRGVGHRQAAYDQLYNLPPARKSAATKPAVVTTKFTSKVGTKAIPKQAFKVKPAPKAPSKPKSNKPHWQTSRQPTSKAVPKASTSKHTKKKPYYYWQTSPLRLHMLDTIWAISGAVHAHFKVSTRPPQKKSKLHKVLYITKTYRRAFRHHEATLSTTSSSQHQPETPPSPPPHPNTNWLTLQDFFQCLWNLPTATPQVSLPGILWPTALLSALSQYLWLKIQPSTHRSSPRSTVSYGLRWQLALHAKAMATAWDLISQTHLELWGQLQDGILTMA